MLHATGERSLGQLGGLIHRMPWVGVAARWSARSRSPACRRSNGFVSEWLLLQAFLFTPGLPQPYRATCWCPVAAAGVALVGGAGGLRDGEVLRRRSSSASRASRRSRDAHDAGRLGARRPRRGWRPAACCWACCPATVIALLEPVTARC
ncbi:MAG: hypothetical protein MZV49_10620 [Rhodopseudomonas palustris]|nr:hypothetical protein [Rhodopseudomonas palustris]